MPMFCSCGFSPLPSGGVNGSRSNGLRGEEHHRDEEAPPRELVTAATYGISARYRAGVSHCASGARTC